MQKKTTYLFFSTGSGFRTSYYSCCFSHSRSCIRDCYCTEDDNNDNTAATSPRRRRPCATTNDLIIQCGK